MRSWTDDYFNHDDKINIKLKMDLQLKLLEVYEGLLLK